MFEHGLILAAGQGTRMLPLTASIPKPLLPNSEDSLLRHQIDFVRDHVRNLHVTVGYMADLVSESALEFGADSVIDIGTGGNASWIRSSNLGLIDSPMIILTCDNIMSVDLLGLRTEVENSNRYSYIIPVEKPSEYAGDRLEVQDDKILAMGPNVTSPLLASGLQIINPRAVSSRNGTFEDFSEVWQTLITYQELKVSRERPKSWMAVDTVENLTDWSKSKLDLI